MVIKLFESLLNYIISRRNNKIKIVVLSSLREAQRIRVNIIMKNDRIVNVSVLELASKIQSRNF